MRIFNPRNLMFFVPALFLLATSVISQKINPSRSIKAEDVFSFRLPVDFKKTETGVDSFMAGFQRGSARFIYVCQDTAGFEKEKMSNVREEAITIDGRNAKMRTFLFKYDNGHTTNITEMLVGGDWNGENVGLYMSMESPQPSDIKTAKQIFQTVKFLKSGCGVPPA